MGPGLNSLLRAVVEVMIFAYIKSACTNVCYYRLRPTMCLVPSARVVVPLMKTSQGQLRKLGGALGSPTVRMEGWQNLTLTPRQVLTTP